MSYITEAANAASPTLADYIQDILLRKAQAGKSQYSQSLYNLKDAANMLNFLTANKIMDMAGLDEKFKSMIGEQFDIRDELKPIERRLTTLQKHIEQAEIYQKYRPYKQTYNQTKPRHQAQYYETNRAELTLYDAAERYLQQHLNGRNRIPLPTWQAEREKLTADRNRLHQRYVALKDEVKEAEQIRKSVYSILRHEQREQQPQKARDVDR